MNHHPLNSFPSARALPRKPDARRRWWLIAVLCMIQVPVLHCGGPGLRGAGRRTVHVRVAVDPDIAAAHHWQQSLAAMFEQASGIFASQVGVSLRIDTMMTIDIERRPSYGTLLLGDCLVREIPRGTSDIVIFFSRSGNPPSMLAAMTLYELGYAHVRLAGSIGDTAIDPRETGVLVHWIAHMLGAAHSYYNGNNVTVMNPFAHDGMVDEPASDRAADAPRFHPGNLMIMRELARRSFDERRPDTAAWPRVRAVYNRVRATYNPWEIDANGRLTNYESDVFHEGNLLSYLSSWASLSGEHRAALEYLDSLERLLTAISRTCGSGGIIGETRLCSICGFDEKTTGAWLGIQRFYIGQRRAIVLLRKGDLAAADSCAVAGLTHTPDQLSALRDKYLNGYEFYRSRYAPQARVFARPQEMEMDHDY